MVCSWLIYTYIYSSCVRAGVCGILFGVLFIKYGAIAVGRTQFCLSPPPSRSEDVQTLHSSRQFFHKQWLGLTLVFPQLGPGPCVVTISGLYTFMSLVKPFGICARGAIREVATARNPCLQQFLFRNTWVSCVFLRHFWRGDVACPTPCVAIAGGGLHGRPSFGNARRGKISHGRRCYAEENAIIICVEVGGSIVGIFLWCFSQGGVVCNRTLCSDRRGMREFIIV